MFEHVLDLNPKAKKDIESTIEEIKVTTDSQKMNMLLDDCKYIVQGLSFDNSDPHM